ncbi:MAG: MMPL family transporter [Bdellovibrionia bacterium]
MMKSGVDRISKFLISLVDFSLARPKTVVAFFLLVAAAAAFQARTLKMELRLYDSMASDFESGRNLQNMSVEFADGNSAVFVFAPLNPEGFTEIEACKIKEWVYDERNASDEIESSFSPFGLRYPEVDEAKVRFPRIFDLPCDGSRNPIVTFASLSQTPWGNLLTDHEAKDIAVEFTYRDSEAGGPYGKFDPTPIGETYERAKTTLGGIARVMVVGKASPQWHIKGVMRKDMRLNVMIILVLVLGLRIFFGTWSSGLLLTASFLITMTIVLGTMALAGAKIDSVSNNLFLLLCISCAEDFLFVSHAQRRKSDLAASFRDVATGGFFTSVTTIIGFLCLATSNLRVISNLGLWAAWAAFIEWVVVFTFLPAVCTVFFKGKVWIDNARAREWAWLNSLEKISLSRGMMRLGRVLPVAGLVGLMFMNFEDSPRDNFPQSHLYRQSLEYIKDTRGWEGVFNVVFDDSLSRKEIEARLEKIKAEPNIASIDSPFALEDFFTTGFKRLVADMLERAVKATPAHKKYFSNEGSARATIYAKSVSLSKLSPTIDYANDVCSDGLCYIAGEQVAYTDYARSVSHTLFGSFLTSVVSVMLVIFLLARARGITPIGPLMFSAIWAPLAMIAVMAIFRVPINLFTAMFASVYVGIAGDNTIQFIFGGDSLQKGIDERAGGTVHLSLLLIAASLVFLGSGLVPVRTLGILFSSGFLIMLIGDLWFLRGLLSAK